MSLTPLSRGHKKALNRENPVFRDMGFGNIVESIINGHNSLQSDTVNLGKSVVNEEIVQPYATWQLGTIETITGVAVSNPIRIRTANYINSKDTDKITILSGFEAYLYFYTHNGIDYVYQGMWNGLTLATSGGITVTSFDFRTLNSEYYYKIVLKKIDNSSIVTGDGVNVTYSILNIPKSLISEFATANGYNEDINKRSTWEHGGISAGTQDNATMHKRMRSRGYVNLTNVEKIIARPGYGFILYQFDTADSYVGYWQPSNFSFGSTITATWESEVDMLQIDKSLKYKIAFRKIDESNLVNDDWKAVSFLRSKINKIDLTIAASTDITAKCDIRKHTISVSSTPLDINNNPNANGVYKWQLLKTATSEYAKSCVIPVRKGYYYTISHTGDRFTFALYKYQYKSNVYATINLGKRIFTQTYTYYCDTDEYQFLIVYYNWAVTNPTITVTEIAKYSPEVGNIIGLRENMYKSKGNLALAIQEQKLEARVNAHIAANGLTIGGVTKTREQIRDWMLNRNNCLYRGKLKKKGKYIVDSADKPVELFGVGLFHTPDLVHKLHTKETLKLLKYHGVNIIRFPVQPRYYYSLGYNKDFYTRGYDTQAATIKNYLSQIINWCEELGLYVIVDWHVMEADGKTGADAYGDGGTGNGNAANPTLIAMATDLFTHVATNHSESPNVLYEILNEPFANTIASLASYITTIKGIITSHVTNPIIILGRCAPTTGYVYSNPATEQDVINNIDRAITDVWDWMQSNGHTDIYISVHDYVTDVNLLSTYQTHWNNNVPLFMTEWGNSDFSGNGAINDARAHALLDWHHTNAVPQCVWKWTYRDSTTSFLNPESDSDDGYYRYGFAESDLTHNGRLFLKQFEKNAFEDYITRSAV
jgi:endoglucanase